MGIGLRPPTIGHQNVYSTNIFSGFRFLYIPTSDKCTCKSKCK